MNNNKKKNLEKIKTNNIQIKIEKQNKSKVISKLKKPDNEKDAGYSNYDPTSGIRVRIGIEV